MRPLQTGQAWKRVRIDVSLAPARSAGGSIAYVIYGERVLTGKSGALRFEV